MYCAMTAKPSALDQSIEVYDQQYRTRGMGSQRAYPNESLIQFMASRYFNLPIQERRRIRVLEVGCGSGSNLWMLAKEGFDAYGLDSSGEALQLAETHLSAKWGVSATLEKGSFMSMPYEDAYFDAVIDVVSLQGLHLADSSRVLREVGRVLKPSGAFFSYRLSDRSSIRDAGPRIDQATLENIPDPALPLANNGPLSFWSPDIAREMYGDAGFSLVSVERVGRTYVNGAYVEYLKLLGTPEIE
jgi:ubiquinone/menaquinone biosynthesis C-methylase UbiE